jgi:hypothetical protein
MSATASAGPSQCREVPKRLRCAAFRGRPGGPSLPAPHPTFHEPPLFRPPQAGARFVPNRSTAVGTGAEPTHTRGLAGRCELGQLALRRQGRFMAGEQVQKEQGAFHEPERRSPIRRVGVQPRARAGSETGAPIARFLGVNALAARGRQVFLTIARKKSSWGR